MMNKPLFEHYPELLHKIPQISLSNTPTPIEKLSFTNNTWVKRDDLTNITYGDNKVRNATIKTAVTNLFS